MDSNDRVRILNAGNLSSLPKAGFETMKPEGKHDRSILLCFILTHGSEGTYNSFMIYRFHYFYYWTFSAKSSSIDVHPCWASVDGLLKTHSAVQKF